jgi:hypothetical protein
VDVEAQIALVADDRLAGVDAHAHAELNALGPVFSDQSTL